MAFKLADAFVLITGNDHPLNATLAAAERRLAGFTSSVSGAAAAAFGAFNRAAGLAAVGAGGALAYGLYRAVHAASDLNEAMDSARTTFGASFAIVNAQADEMNKKFGIARKSQIEWADGFGTIAQQLGQTESQSAKFANTFTKLAADFSSKKNLSFADAALKLQAGVSGEAEPLKRYIGLIDEATVKNYAYAHGLARSGSELDQNTKFAARSALITERMTKFMGDLERTQDSTANRSRNLSGAWETLAENVGTAFLPATNQLLGFLTKMTADLSAFFETNKSQVDGFIASVRGSFDGLEFVYDNFSNVSGIAAVNFAEMWLNAGERLIWFFTELIPAGLRYLAANITTVIPDAFSATLTALKNFGADFVEIVNAVWEYARSGFSKPFEVHIKPLLEGFEATSPAFEAPELKLTSLDADRQKFLDEIANRETRRLQKPKAAPGAAPEAAASPTATGPVAKPGKAKFSDLESFYQGLQEGAFGKDDAAKKTAQFSELTAKGVDELVRQGRRPPPPAPAIVGA